MLNVFGDGEGIVRTADGVRIFYRTAGEGQTTVLLLHGWASTGSGSFWGPVLRGLHHDANIRCVLVDLRGHGRSDHTRDGFTTERFAEDLFEVADHLGAREFVVAAYSMSGRWAQWMSCVRPERVLGQILIAPVSASPMPLTEATVEDWVRSVSTRDLYRQFENRFMKEPLSEADADMCFAAVQRIPEYSLRQLSACAPDQGSPKSSLVFPFQRS